MYPLQADLLGIAVVALPLLFLTVLVAAVLYFSYREQALIIETGHYESKRRADRRWVLAVGLVLVAIGMASAVEALVVGNLAQFDLTLGAVGLAALAYYYLVAREERVEAEATGDGTADR